MFDLKSRFVVFCNVNYLNTNDKPILTAFQIYHYHPLFRISSIYEPLVRGIQVGISYYIQIARCSRI